MIVLLLTKAEISFDGTETSIRNLAELKISSRMKLTLKEKTFNL